MVLAARRQPRRDRALVEADRRRPASSRSGAHDGPPPRARPASASTARSASSIAGSPPSRGQLAGGRARHDHEVVPGLELVRAGPEGLAQQPLDAVALDGAAELAADRDAQARRRRRRPARGNA